jgi:protein SCO1/2
LKAKGKRQKEKGRQGPGLGCLRSGLLLRFTSCLLTFFSLLPFSFCLVSAQAQNTRPQILQDVSIDQRLNEQVPLDLTFRDENGRAVRLGDYFETKPVILALVYYQCPMLCNELLNGLVSSLRVLSFDVGEQFDVVAVSFDPKEDPTLAKDAKTSYLKRYGRRGTPTGWHFLTGEPVSISRLTQAVGFRFYYDTRINQYAHASGIMVLTPLGKLSRYFYGIEFAPRDLRLALVEASANKIGSLADQVLLFCYHYDPSQGKYGFIIMNVIRLCGILFVLSIGIFIVWMLRREDRGWRIEDRGYRG